MENTKKCPYCGEEIMADAKKCKHCGEWLNDEVIPKQKTQQENDERKPETPTRNEVESSSQSIVATPATESVPAPQKESLFKSCFWEQMTKHYCDFKGTVDRKTFWICYLYWVLIMWVIGGLSLILPLIGNALMLLVSLGLTLPFLGLMTRRLHDIGKKGTWILIALVPLVGPIWFLVLMVQKGETKNPNKWNVKDTIITIMMLVVSLGLFAVGLFATDSETSERMQLPFKNAKNSETTEIEKQVLDAYNDGSIYGLMTPEFKAADEAADEAAGEAESMFGEIFHDADIFYNTQDELPDVVGVRVELTDEYEALATVTLRFYGDWGSRWDSTVLVMVRDNLSVNSKNARWLVDDVISSYVNDRGEVVYYSQKAAMNEFAEEQYGARAYIPDESESGFSYDVDDDEAPDNIYFEEDEFGNEVRVVVDEYGNEFRYPAYFDDEENDTVKIVVIDGSELRLRLGPSTDSETLKWGDGSNRHPNIGEKYRYLDESGGFYKIDFKGNEVWVSKQFTHIELQ